MRRIDLSLFLTALFALFLLPEYAKAQSSPITLGLTTRNGTNSLPYVIAEEKGFFKAEGLNAIIIVMQNQVVVNGVVSRNVDYGGTFSNFIGAAMSGAPVRIVMSVMEGADHYLVTSPNIKRVEDLKGKTFGISSFGGTPHSEAIAILKKYGMNPEKDVTFLQIGGSSARYMALEGGSVQAVLLVPPFNKLAKKHGFNELLGFNDIMSLPIGGLAVHTQKMKEKPDEIVKMIRAILKGIDYIRNRKADVLAMMDSQWGVKEADIREGIYRDILGLYSRTGIGTDEGMKNVIRLVRETRKNAPEAAISDVADWSFAKKAQEGLK
ncbi:MAG TPA: ABC transporter substrate-binding protein [Verrucomicrobiae bacterium]|jgi:NitT/TauT family transport system substrate-binding protein|nr:ABC transporter substrate-binding protein [Verrucomicrobiae bacterium]